MGSKLDQFKCWCQRRSLLEIVLLAVTLRVAVAVLAFGRADGVQSFHLEDTHGYVQLAKSLLSEGCFSSGGHAEVLRTPGYPVFLLPGVAAGHVEAVTIGLQIVLSGATVYLVYFLALAVLANQNLARLAAALYAVETLSLLFCCKVMSETLFTFLVMLFLWGIVGYLSHGRWSALLLGATALGAAILVRPVAYYLPLAMGCGLTLRGILSAGNRRLALLQVAAFIGVAWSPAWAWQIRNQVSAGYCRYAAIEDVNLFFYSAASVLAAQRGIPLGEQNVQMGVSDVQHYLELHPEQSDWSEVERYSFMRREGLSVLRNNLSRYALIHVLGIAPLMLGGGTSECIQLLSLDNGDQDQADRQFDGVIGYAWNLLLHHTDLFCCNVALSCIAVAFLGAAAIGVFSRQTPRGMATLLLLCVSAYFVVLSAGPSGRPRYRHPVMPIACVFAAPGLALLVRRLARGAAQPPLDAKELLDGQLDA